MPVGGSMADEAAGEAHKAKRARPAVAKKADGTDGAAGGTGTDGAGAGTDHGEPVRTSWSTSGCS